MTDTIRILFKRLPHGEGLPLPSYATHGAAGMDVVAAEALVLAPSARAAVATGFAIAIPHGYEVQVRPRSGLALHHGVTCLNTPGTIDSDYRGEVRIILANLGAEPFAIARGERIAQLVPAAVQRADLAEVADLDETERGAGGFGVDRPMIAAALVLMLQAATAPLPPVNWSTLPLLRYARPQASDVDLSGFVRAEVKAGRCARAIQVPGGWSLTVDLAVLATPQATVRRVVPKAIDCPAVEQYAAGIVSSLVRGNIDTDGTLAEGWYRTRMTFFWRA